jgi:tRNA (guanine-N7-)-methyltransferase
MSDAQERAWQDLSAHYVIDVERDAAATSVRPGTQIARRRLRTSRAARRRDRVGAGHAIVHAASTSPERDFLAVEVFRAGLARTMLDADRAGATNLRLVEANAPEVLEHLLPEGSVDELWIFFPDPGTRPSTTSAGSSRPPSPLAARALRDGGLLRLATDWEDYAVQMRDVMGDAADFTPRSRVLGAALRGTCHDGVRAQGLQKGREIRDLVYRRESRV